MTRKEVKELLPIIKAFCDGKTIQHLDIIKDKWEDIDEFVYHGSVKSYRIKPDSQPKYRPFKDTEECLKEMQKHQPFGWIERNGFWYNIISTGITYVKIIDTGGAIATLCFDDLLSHYSFVDGTPFGVKVEE